MKTVLYSALLIFAGALNGLDSTAVKESGNAPKERIAPLNGENSKTGGNEAESSKTFRKLVLPEVIYAVPAWNRTSISKTCIPA